MTIDDIISALRNCLEHGGNKDCRIDCPYVDQSCGACAHEQMLYDAANALEAAASEIESRDLLLEKQKKEIRNLSEKVEYWRELFRRSETVRGMDEKEREALEAERKLLALERRLRDAYN